MKPKTTLFTLIVCAFCLLLFNPNNAAAQNFRATGIRIITANPDSCANTIVEVDTYLGCINWTVGPSSFSIAGSTITLDVNYTSSFICAGAISMPIFNINLGSIPPGNYTLVADAYLDNTLTNSFSGPTMSVSSCIATSIEESDATNLLSIYPNPSSGELTINVSNNTEPFISYQLIDIKGSVLLSGNLDVINEKAYLNTETIPSGVYILQTQIGSKMINKKISLL